MKGASVKDIWTLGKNQELEEFRKGRNMEYFRSRRPCLILVFYVFSPRFARGRAKVKHGGV